MKSNAKACYIESFLKSIALYQISMCLCQKWTIASKIEAFFAKIILPQYDQMCMPSFALLLISVTSKICFTSLTLALCIALKAKACL